MQVRPDKFYPPQVDTPSFLARERVVEELLRRCGARRPDITLVAQAGQGKTTLVKQLLDHQRAASVWYQVGPEDADPAAFLVSIHACVGARLPDGPSETTRSGLTGGEIAPFDLPKRIDLLLKDLQDGLESDLYIVFDDLHHLLGHGPSLLILDYLLDKAPPRLHFVLSSREPLPLASRRASPGCPNTLAIGNQELALSENEVADFFLGVFQRHLPRETARAIRESTEGWVMGVLLLGLTMEQRDDDAPAPGPFAADRQDIRDYFRQEIFTALEPRLHRPLMLLSLLEHIPAELARTITGEAGIGGELERLALRNVFIRRLDAQAVRFGLHHLFRQFLREKAREELPENTLRTVERQAGLFFFQQGDPVLALRHLLQARDHAAVEAVLTRHGTALLAANQTATLTAILGRIPEQQLAGLGWAAFYLALAHLDFAPARALPLLNRALAAFRTRGDEPGELLCLAHSISIHITTTGHYREGEELLLRAEALLERLGGALDASNSVLLDRSLAMGRCIFLADTETALRYASRALELARQERLVNFEAAMLPVMGYIHIFAGQMSLARLWLEQAARALRRPEVGTFNCLAIRMMLFNFLFHDGEFDNYFDQKAQLVAAIDNVMVSQSIAGPFCFIWEMDIALNHGQDEEALRLAGLGLQDQDSPHLRSQLLQLQAVALARLGRSGQALDAADQATRLRERAGGRYFIALNRILSGLTLALLGQTGKALDLLDQGIDNARSMPTAYLEACGLLHRGWVHLLRDDCGKAREDIRAGLGLMRRNAYRHFWAWTPQAARAVLGFAAARGLEADYARLLAARRLDVDLLDDGAPIPRLEFRTLGGFSIHMQGALLLGPEELTPAQRELLCLLLTAPGLKMAQETALLHFWPDSSTSAAKTKFDTMISRLRKVLAEALPDGLACRYLNRDKGILWLAHCRVDAVDFLQAVNQGLEHERLHEHWQACNAFTRAERLWKGEFAPGVTGEDQIRAFRDLLGKALTQLAQNWCGLLESSARLQTAVEFAERALRADPLNDALWMLLYRLEGRRSAIGARKVLLRLAELLRAEDYPENEIAHMVETIASAR